MKNAPSAVSRLPTHRATTATHRLPHHPATLSPVREGETDTDLPFEDGVHDAIDPDLRHRLISEAAFAMYAERGFVDGFDQEDWFRAEDQIEHTVPGSRPAREA